MNLLVCLNGRDSCGMWPKVQITPVSKYMDRQEVDDFKDLWERSVRFVLLVPSGTASCLL